MTFTTTGPDEQRYNGYEEALVAEFGDFLACPALAVFVRMKLNSLSSEKTKAATP
jgi:hypothetical protein